MSAPKKRGLGRGLEALLGPKAAATQPPEAQPGEALRQIPVKQLQPGKYQPRMAMDPAKLSELAESIKAQGVIQPIVVRELARASTRSSPANAAGAPRRKPGWPKCRWWCANWTTAPSSPWP